MTKTAILKILCADLKQPSPDLINKMLSGKEVVKYRVVIQGKVGHKQSIDGFIAEVGERFITLKGDRKISMDDITGLLKVPGSVAAVQTASPKKKTAAKK